MKNKIVCLIIFALMINCLQASEENWFGKPKKFPGYQLSQIHAKLQYSDDLNTDSIPQILLEYWELLNPNTGHTIQITNEILAFNNDQEAKAAGWKIDSKNTFIPGELVIVRQRGRNFNSGEIGSWAYGLIGSIDDDEDIKYSVTLAQDTGSNFHSYEIGKRSSNNLQKKNNCSIQ
ncbi:MAG: hypothetical protein P4L22_03215 [Candidatus Babeliales bacterium]|nr:hypothetical protein [Candidatus Babeliales bacterium]